MGNRADNATGRGGGPTRAGAAALGVAAPFALGAEQGGAPAEGGDILPFVNEQIILLATIVLAVGSLPPIIEFLIERRKRKERLALSVDETPVASLHPRLAGLDGLLASIDDLIDRVRRPEAYPGLSLGNEILIIGPPLSGKKSLAHRIAQEARLESVVTVYNPRNADALAKARTLALRDADRRVMLLLPRLDVAFEDPVDEALSELDALVEGVSGSPNVLVVGTATRFELGSDLDNLFGVKIAMPGANLPGPQRPQRRDAELERVLREVAAYYLARAVASGLTLDGMSEEEFTTRVLERVSSPSEIEDIVTVCQTSAIHRARASAGRRLALTAEMLHTAIQRVVPGPTGIAAL